MRTHWICLFLLLSNLLQAQLSEQQFHRPETVYAPRVFWHWMNGNVSREGINLDLESMAATGLGGGILFNQIGSVPKGSVQYLSAEWIGLAVHVLEQADRLDLKFMLHVDPDFSGDEGQWVMPENATKKIVWSETLVKGGDKINILLPRPMMNQGFYKEVAVLAFTNENRTIVSNIVDLTNHTDAEGRLSWNVPKGSWTVVRIGCSVSEDVAHDSSDSPEMDKLNPNGIKKHLEKFLEPLFEQTRPFHGRSFEGLTIDSCSIGSLGWTEDMVAEFQKRAGYNLKPFLLVFTGRQVNSSMETARFLWDLHRVQTEMLEEYYYDGIREMLKKKGLNLLVERYDNPGSTKLEDNPSDMKTYFDRNFVNRMHQKVAVDFEHQPHPTAKPGIVMDSCGILNNRNNTWFSKSTDCFEYVRRCHYILQSGLLVADAAYFTGEGSPIPTTLISGHTIGLLNRNDLLQRASVKNGVLVLPDGMIYRILILPNMKTISLPVLRKLKLLLEDGLWISAIKPTNWYGHLSLKEQAEWKAIVEDVWNKLPAGIYRYGVGRLFINVPDERLYEEVKLTSDFSYVSSVPNAEINYLHNRIGSEDVWFVSNGRFRNDTIMASFRVKGMQPEWWDPQTGEIRPINIYRQHDEQTLIPLIMQPYESGFVVFRKAITQPVFDGLTKDGILFFSANPDLFPGNLPTPNQNGVSVSDSSTTTLPDMLILNGNRLFRKKGSYALVNSTNSKQIQEPLLLKKNLPIYQLSKDWMVHFPEGGGVPKQLILDSLTSLHTVKEIGVKYFSGTASWQRTFQLTTKDLKGNQLVLDLGQVANVAEIYVNGKSAGLCWKPPFRLNVTNLLKPGENELDIRVTNLWVNRLIGDEFLPSENQYDERGVIKVLPDWYKNGQPKIGDRVTFSTRKNYDQKSPLIESGLIGPVTLSAWRILLE